jgi:hypothetical protein
MVKIQHKIPSMNHLKHCNPYQQNSPYLPVTYHIEVITLQMDSWTNILFAFPTLPPQLQITWLLLFNNALLTVEFIQHWMKREDNELWIHRDLEEGGHGLSDGTIPAFTRRDCRKSRSPQSAELVLIQKLNQVPPNSSQESSCYTTQLDTCAMYTRHCSLTKQPSQLSNQNVMISSTPFSEYSKFNTYV